MKFATIIFCAFTLAVMMAKAGEITLLIKQAQGLKFMGDLTNATATQVYIAPFYLEEQFYAQPNCSDCPTGWVAGRPMAINDAKDFIPVAPRASIKFVVIGNPNPKLSWRITCVAVTNSVHVSDKTTFKEKSHILIHSPEISGIKFQT